MASKKRHPPADDQPTAPAVLSPKALAARWGVTCRSLDRWRQAGTGPAYFYLSGKGGKVAYRLTTIEAYEAEQERRSTSDKLAA